MRRLTAVAAAIGMVAAGLAAPSTAQASPPRAAAVTGSGFTPAPIV